MTLATLLKRNLRFHWRNNLAVLLGVIVGTAVLSGALLVGDSLRGSMRDLTLDRLGKIDVAVVSDRFFRADLAQRLQKATDAPIVAPAIVLRGSTFRGQDQRLGAAQVLGVDDAFWPLFAMEPARLEEGIWVNQALARGVVHVGDYLEVRLEKPQTVPADSLLGRPTEDPGLTLESSPIARVLPNEGVGAFSLDAMQQLPRSAFVQLQRLQQRLRDTVALPGSANALFIQLPPGGNVASIQQALDEVAEIEDLGLRIIPDGTGQRYLAIESRRMLIEPEVVDAVRALSAANGWKFEPTLTYLANRISAGDKFVPYSTVTGLDPAAPPPWGPLLLTDGQAAPALAEDEIIINEWLASDLGPVKPGDKITLTYFVESDGWLLKEETAEFRLAGVASIAGPANDRTLTPELPGMRATSIRDWNPPFPKEQWHPEWVRERDEQYWRRYRATPKAFVSPITAQRLWRSQHGQYTALRLAPAEGKDLAALEAALRRELRRALPASKMGLKPYDVKNQGLAAAGSSTAQAFGFLFVSFSFFLIVSAALLVGLLFRLGVEQRAQELGILLATGFRQRTVRWLLLAEGAVIASLGSILGLVLAVGYAGLLLAALRGLWSGSPLQVSFLKLHVARQDPLFGPLPYPSLAVGFLAGTLLALATIYWSTRVLNRLAPRELLGGKMLETSAGEARRRWSNVATGGLIAVALLCAGASWLVDQAAAAPLFFASGTCLLLAGIGLASWWLRDRRADAVRGHGVAALVRLGALNTQRNRGRSLLTLGLIASATFLIVAVEAFRKDPSAARAGVGGFSLVAEADVPLFQPPNTSELRKALWPDASDAELEQLNRQLTGVAMHGFRLRPGDDVSCLNLYQPQQPRILGVPRSLVERGGFAFGPLLDPTPEERANPWRMLDRPGGAVPILVDDHTAQWVLQKKVGDEWALKDEHGRSITVQLVGMLHGSIFQSELLTSEERFRQLFPSRGGYSFFLIDVPPGRENEVGKVLEKVLGGRHGLSVTPALDRLAQYYSVENAYLSTFQLLGGLGLLLGTLGLAVVLLRNVWERRGELALLQALGFRQGDVGWLVFAENGFLVLMGLLVGVVAASVAVFPHVMERAGRMPWVGMAALVVLVFATGMLAGLLAVRSTLRLPLLATLRKD